MNILVTDGENRSALAVARSLGRKGHAVFVSGLETMNLSASSGFCRKSFATPDPLEYGERYSAAIAEIILKEHIDVIFPMTEQSVYILNRARRDFGTSVVLACASHEKMEAVSNKYRLFQLAENLGIAMPKTEYVNGRDGFSTQKVIPRDFPVVVKPAFSKVVAGERIISSGVMYAKNQDELCRLYNTKEVLQYPSLIQELIVGEGTGLFTLFDGDRHLALFSHRRLLEKPPSGGVSVLSESIPLDDGMVEAAHRLLAAVKWTGIAMVEFKRDTKDGTAKLMEINGRFWGSLQLAVSSGVDFPALCLDYYLGNKPVALISDYIVGRRLKWALGMLDHLIIRMKSGGQPLNLPPDLLTRWQVAMELIKVGDAKTSFDVYDRKDLRPFGVELKTYIRTLL
jgi:predicted ATP-grasp superfamily ATP-dependent carboligase